MLANESKLQSYSNLIQEVSKHMIAFIVRFLVSRLTADNLIELGNLLVSAGGALKARQQTIAEAMRHVQTGLSKVS